MKRTLLPLLAIVAFALPAPAQTPSQRRVPANPASLPAQVTPAQNNPRPPTPAPPPTPTPTPPPTQQPGICCCRVWSHGWQYSWRPNAECTTQSGSCVTPDHC